MRGRGTCEGCAGGHHTGPQGRGQRPPAPRLRGHGRLWGCSSRPGEASQPCAESRPILLSACLPAQPSAGPSTKALPDVRSPLLGSSCPFVGLTRQAGTRLPADDGLTCPPPGPLRTRCHWEACGTWPRSCRPSTLEGFPRPPHRPQAMPTWHVCPPLALTLCSLRLRPDPCLNRSSPDPCHPPPRPAPPPQRLHRPA